MTTRVPNEPVKKQCAECDATPEGIYRLSALSTSSSSSRVESPVFPLTTIERGSASSTASSCVWCLRFGVNVAPNSNECNDLQRAFGCHRCDRTGCWAQNSGQAGIAKCEFYGRSRPHVADAPVTGSAAPDMFERTSVRVTRERGRIVVSINDERFIKGYASGQGCNCLIASILSCLNDKGILCVASVTWIREELQRQFPRGENQVTRGNFLDLRNHWRSIIDLIGISARNHGCDPAAHITSENFAVTCVLEEGERVYEADGDGLCRLFLINEGNSHFSPLLGDRQHWRASSTE